MATRKYISRNEAAEMCNVHPQTITNWSDKGLIRKATRMSGGKKVFRFLADDVEKMSEVALEMEGTDIEIEEYMKALQEQKDSLQEDIEAMRREREDMDVIPAMLKTMQEVSIHILNVYYSGVLRDIEGAAPLTPREVKVCEDAIKLVPLWKTAENLKLGYERTRQIREKAKRKMALMCNVVDVKETLDHNAELIRKNNELTIENERLREVLAVKENEKIIVKDDKVYQALTMRLNLIPMSVRLFNLMKCIDAETLGDIASYPIAEVVRFRNLGRKSLWELQDILEKHGLRMGMDVEQYGVKSHYKAELEKRKRRGW
ncbi:MAG: hypothetical protein MJZ12_00180 [Prevotella sp.]|nr:hypothetical protein [Prevotella sp.]